ncbi:MAG: GreA/GreB family elongation factor [Myxococcales bacterium]|nr:GreA/GreB family elongation factor [Myxococcales bacterium]
MSKAFTKESEDLPEPPVRRRGVPVPEFNLVTPDGLAAARAELEELTRRGGDPDRLRALTDHLATAQAVEPGDLDEVGLGATVTVEDDDGQRRQYRIVGAIEGRSEARLARRGVTARAGAVGRADRRSGRAAARGRRGRRDQLRASAAGVRSSRSRPSRALGR